MEISCGVRIPQVEGMSTTEMGFVGEMDDRVEAGRRQSLGILAATDSRLERARGRQSGMEGVAMIG